MVVHRAGNLIRVDGVDKFIQGAVSARNRNHVIGGKVRELRSVAAGSSNVNDNTLAGDVPFQQINVFRLVIVAGQGL